MGRVAKWGLLTLAGLFVGLVFVGLLAFTVGKRSVAPLSGELQLAGMAAPVEIVRDADAIPHILAQNRIDAARALGFVHAQDRLWQMDLLRMTGQGRLSELFGVNEDVQNIDRLLRALGFMEQARKSVSALTKESQSILNAYAEGVNAWMERETDLAEARFPVEFLFLGRTPEAWEPAHSLVVLKIMALNLSMNMSREMDRMHLAARGLNSGEIDDLIFYDPTDRPPPLPDLTKLYPLQAVSDKTAQSTLGPFLANLLHDTGTTASNNWVFAGNRTATGKPILANDPHLAFNAPNLWYLAHMRWNGPDGQPINVIGATIPSVPAVILGRNDHIAWGFTNAGGDAQDLYVEKLREAGSDEYLTPDGWKTFKREEQIIKVRGGEDVPFVRRVSRHGPVLPSSYRDNGSLLGDEYVLSLAWTGLSDQDRNFDLVSNFATARTVGDFTRNLDVAVAPMQVMVVADTAGGIGLFSKAALPQRKPENQLRGRAPSPGWDAVYDWEGLIPATSMPAITNPPSGALGSANAKFVRENQQPFLTYDWAERFRFERVKNLTTGENEKHTLAASIAGQLDKRSEAMMRFRDHLINAMGENADERARLVALSAWDGEMRADRPEPLMITAIFRNAMKVIFQDDLGAAISIPQRRPATVMLGVLDQGGARDWCDDRATPRGETCYEMLRRAYADAMVELEATHGENWKSWKWGDAHVLSAEHQPFGKVAPLRRFFDVERPMDGGNYTLLRARNNLGDKRPYRAVHGAGYRAVYDLADLNRSVYIQTTGQSGNVFSPFYDQMADRWAKGDYITMTTDDAAFSAQSIGTWRLLPAN